MHEHSPTALLPARPSQWIVLLTILLSALVLNLVIPPAAPIHPNTHGIKELRTILDPGLPVEMREFYGPLYIGFMRTVCTVVGWSEQTVYATNAVLGALAVALLFLLARVLGFDAWGALLAAGLLATHPAHVWLSGAEGPMPLYEVLLLLGLLTMVSGLARQRPGLLWVSALALGMACRLHVLTLAALPLAVGVGFWTRRRMGLRLSGVLLAHVLAAVALATTLWATHLWDLRWVPESFAGKVRGESSFYQFTRGNILFDPTLTALPALGLIVWGAVVLVRRNRPLALLLAWCFVVLVPAGLLVNSLRTDAVRYQTPTHWVLFLAAGAVLVWPPVRRVSRVRTGLWGLAALAILANAAYGWSVVAQGDLASQAYLFTRRALADLSPGETIHLPRLQDDYRRLLLDVPVYDEPVKVVVGEMPGNGELVYLGLDCYRDPDLFAGRFDADGKRVECTRACETMALEPVAVTRLDYQPPALGHHHLFHVLTTPRPVVGFYRCVAAP